MDPKKNYFFDYFKYINHNFILNNPIPESETRWGVFDMLSKINEKKGMKILNDINEDNLDTIYQDFLTNKDQKQLKNMYYFQKCLNNNDDKKSFNTLLNIINEINILYEKNQNQSFIEEVICLLNNHSIQTIFNLNLENDPKNKNITRLYLTEGGIYLPDKDFYFDKNEKMNYFRKMYKAFIQKLFEYITEIEPTLFSEIDKYMFRHQVYYIEKNIANCFDEIEKRHNIDSYYNLIDLEEELPQYDWRTISKNLEFDLTKEDFWITSPSFFSKLHKFISKTIDTKLIYWKNYFIYCVIKSNINYFQKEYKHLSNLHFEYIKRVRGQKKRKNIKYRNYNYTNNVYGFLIGKIFNHLYFDEKSLKKINEMILQIKLSFKERLLKYNKWMCNETMDKAIRKLENMRWKIGIVEETDEFPIYADITIKSDENDIIDLIQRIDNWYYHYFINKHKKERVKNEWNSFPHVVNAFYNPSDNEMTFPAGILQKPFFSVNYSNEKNYGGIGCVIGHELTHAFDPDGSQFDENGEYKTWWNEEDKNKYQIKQKKIEQIYSLHYLPGYKIPINGVLTSGENIADIGGLRISLNALKNIYSKQNSKYNIENFFKQYTICECNYRNNETQIIQLKTDPHSPSLIRVNIVFNFIPEFFEYLKQTKLIDQKYYKDFEERINMGIEIW